MNYRDMYRLWKLIVADIHLQYKYGIYFIYFIFTITYLFLLQAIPARFREGAAGLLIFSDPAIMGLFFMGAIILLEKNQRVLESIAVSPVRICEYLLAKTVSISCISTLVSMVLALGSGLGRLYIICPSVFIASFLYSTLGLLAAFYSNTLNRFLFMSILFQFLFTIPGILCAFSLLPYYMLWHPAALALLGIRGNIFASLFLCIWAYAFFTITLLAVKKKLCQLGGGCL